MKEEFFFCFNSVIMSVLEYVRDGAFVSEMKFLILI